tara:strand:- start:1266 stop:1739 length:474 start_codon:yes stop_codon:yes gene_type:complete
MKNILGIAFKYEDDKLYRLNKYTNEWSCCSNLKGNNKGYIRIKINKKMYYLHRLIYKYFNEEWDLTDTSYNNLIDHIDINPSNNKIENLRIVNNSQNTRNQNKKENCSSTYRGVCWHKSNSKWGASICINYKLKHLGYFANEEEAHLAYKKVYDENT